MDLLLLSHAPSALFRPFKHVVPVVADVPREFPEAFTAEWRAFRYGLPYQNISLNNFTSLLIEDLLLVYEAEV
jgi:hypothetical protein